MNNDLIITENALDKAQQAIITQSTPADEIRTRQGRGGRRLSYVDHAYVTRLLNNAFAFNWDFETDEAEVLYVGEKPYEVKCRGKLTIRVGNMSIVKMQYGCQPLEFMKNDQDKPVSLGDAFKGAASDALKKCASLLGVALDLYDSDSDINTRASQSPLGMGKQPAQPSKNFIAGPSGEAVEVKPAVKAANGDKKPIDPMTRFWSEVNAAGLSRQKGQEILAAAGNDPSRAVDVLNGMAQA